MRRTLLLAAILVPGIARAGDPRDAFGLPKKTEAPLDCSDGKSFGCIAPTDPLSDDANTFALTTWLPASYLLSLPVADATQDQVAHYAMGAGRDDAGPSFGGATGAENRWLIDGAPADGIRTGLVDTRIPLVFLEGMYVTAGGFAARDRNSTGGVIDARLKDGTADHEVDVRAFAGWIGAEKHQPILPDTYQVRRGQLDDGPSASASVVATGPIGDVLGGHAWYAAGLAPSLSATDFTWHTTRLVDNDNDGIPDGLPGLVENDSFETLHKTPITWAIPAMARAGLDRGHHHVEVTLIGTEADDVRYLFNSTLRAGGVDQRTFVGDAIATWHGTWTDTRAMLQASWHRSTYRESALDSSAANVPQLLTAYVPDMISEDPAVANACRDSGSDPYPKIVNCPVPFGYFASGGAGPLTSITGDRPTISGELAHRFGGNVVRIGATGEDSRLVTDTHFTGGEQIRSLFPGETSERMFLDPNQACSTDLAQPCPTSDHSTLSYRTRYTAAYVEDTWRPTSNITVDGGLRWELMWVGTVLHFSDELAPRLGASWDPTGEGRARVWTSMGRSFAMLPAGLGQTIIGHDRTVDFFTSSFGMSRVINTGAPVPIANDIEPVAQDELTAGIDYAWSRAVRARVWLQGRWLRRGLETEAGVLDNPGQLGLDPAERESEIFAAEIQTAPTAQLALRVGYLYGRTVGNFAGPFDPREGVTLYNGTDFDAAAINMRGTLPSDPGNRFYLEAERRGHLAGVAVGISTRLTVGSGQPRDVLANADDGIIYLLPRGADGRNPMTSQANVRLSARWHGFDVTLDLFNLFDQRTPTEVSTFYTGGAVHPIVGGTAADLVFLHTDNDTPAVRSVGYLIPTQYQAPFSAVLGIHRAL